MTEEEFVKKSGDELKFEKTRSKLDAHLPFQKQHQRIQDCFVLPTIARIVVDVVRMQT